MLSASEKRKLQMMIDNAVDASNRNFRAHQKLVDWCRSKYGCEPGDRDADDILDGVLGYAGECAGMSAADFDKTMTEE